MDTHLKGRGKILKRGASPLLDSRDKRAFLAFFAEDCPLYYTVHMKKRVNIAGLRWSIKEIVGIVIGAVATIAFLAYLSTKLQTNYFLSTLAIIVTAIAGLIEHCL